MEKPQLIKITRKDVLTSYYNDNLAKLIAHEIDIDVFKKLIEKEGLDFVVEEKSQPVGEVNGQMAYSTIRVKAKDKLLDLTNKHQQFKNLVDIIEEKLKLIETEENV